MSKIKCNRCGEKKGTLDEAPFNNDLGQKVLEQTCADCWQAWVSQQLMLMNEYRLDPLYDEHSNFLDKEMQKYLLLT